VQKASVGPSGRPQERHVPGVGEGAAATTTVPGSVASGGGSAAAQCRQEACGPTFV
jgi:hypothetical protein